LIKRKKDVVEIVDGGVVSPNVSSKEDVKEEFKLSKDDEAWLRRVSDDFRVYDFVHEPEYFVRMPPFLKDQQFANLLFAIFGEMRRLNDKLDKVLEAEK